MNCEDNNFYLCSRKKAYIRKSNPSPMVQKAIADFLNAINDPMATVMVVLLSITGLWFTIRTRGVQFRMIGEMCRLLVSSEGATKARRRVSSFQAFAVSLASRVGTGNLAGVATAIVVGGPGAVFWMWVMALIGSVNAFVECTLAQLFKIKGKDSYIGGPAYYITKALKKRWFAVIFAVAVMAQFGFTNNMVQANTISSAFSSAFGINHTVMAVVVTVLSMCVIFGGIRRIAKVCSVIVPFMAISYLCIALWVIVTNITAIPEALLIIVKSAFGIKQAAGGAVGMAILMGFKRGLFSNEAGEGSAPNAAATAEVSHPVKQGLVQTLGVFTDTLVICSCTAFIIMCSGLYDCGANGVELTQMALSHHIGPAGKYIIAICIFFFAFSTVIGNYYYGESNLTFLCNGSKHTSKVILGYRIALGVMIFVGSMMAIDVVWAMVDFSMIIMTLCNLTAILLLGKYAVRLLDDYQKQRKAGRDPVYKSSTIPEIEADTECWK